MRRSIGGMLLLLSASRPATTEIALEREGRRPGGREGGKRGRESESVVRAVHIVAKKFFSLPLCLQF